MPVVNKRALTDMIAILEMLPEEKFLGIKSEDDEAGFREVIRQYIKPLFLALDENSQKICRDSLRYFLVTDCIDFGDIFAELQDSNSPEPANCRDFFLWIWQEVFPGVVLDLGDDSPWERKDEFGVLRNKNMPEGIFE
ncbi:MAG: hypothetical protein U0894_07270 [Pirellulales bacterium]